jgi:hypothetical protein
MMPDTLHAGGGPDPGVGREQFITTLTDYFVQVLRE